MFKAFIFLWPITSLITYAVLGNYKGFEAWGLEGVSVMLGFCFSLLTILIAHAIESRKDFFYSEDD